MPALKSPSTATKRSAKKIPASDESKLPSELIDLRIAELQDWRGKLLGELRAVIRDADPGITEEWKWNTPVWFCNGILCTGETYRKVVKLTFAKGASLPDPSGLFNSSLEGSVRRAIDFARGRNRECLRACRPRSGRRSPEQGFRPPGHVEQSPARPIACRSLVEGR